MDQQTRIVFGYNRGPADQVEIHSLQAMAVELIYRCYAEGDSMLQIKKRLECAGIPSPMNKKTWSQQSISNILDYAQYVGDDTYPRIISPELMNAVQYTRKERIHAAQDGARYTSAHPLSGKIVCGECGRGYRRLTDRNHRVIWRCVNRVEHGSSVCKNSPTVMDEAVQGRICQHMTESDIAPSCERDLRSWVLKRLRRICVQSDGAMAIEES